MGCSYRNSRFLFLVPGAQPVLETEHGAGALVHDVGEAPDELAGTVQTVHELVFVEGGVP